MVALGAALMSKYPPGKHPNSLAALKPFKTGDSRRQCGAPSFGRQITSAMNELARTNEQGDAVYTESDLNEIIGNVRSSHARVIAAREILRARLGTFDKIGRIPQAANSLERIYDRTDGRPTQTIRLEAKTTRTAIEIKADIKALIVSDPGIADLLRKTAEPVLDGLESSIETAEEVPEKKRLPAAARAAEDTAIKNIANAKAKPEPKDPPEAAKAPDRRPPDDISAWM